MQNVSLRVWRVKDEETPEDIQEPREMKTQWLWEEEGGIRQRQKDKVMLSLQFAP